jgi:rhodanese-related sulfurtransferase/rubrerythrin
MYFQNLFGSIPSITPAEVKSLIDSKPANEYCLLDVRQPMEYQQGRLPGSLLIPLGELHARADELERNKMVVVYCRTGSRSASATNMLMSMGFNKVLNMQGGIVQYNGMIASGPPESAAACFSPSMSAIELAATAWIMEDGTIRFIEALCNEILNHHEPALFDRILEAKRTHQATLVKMAEDLMQEEAEEVDFPAGVVELPAEPIMVGCIKVADALSWAKDKHMKDLLELMMTLSANAFDFYLRLGRATPQETEYRVFDALAKEEQQHLQRLAQAYESEFNNS